MAQIKDKKTGEIKSAVYAPHRGRMVYHVEIDGVMTPLSDKEFDKKCQIISK